MKLQEVVLHDCRLSDDRIEPPDEERRSLRVGAHDDTGNLSSPASTPATQPSSATRWRDPDRPGFALKMRRWSPGWRSDGSGIA